MSPYFDGSLIYGPNKAWTDAIRLFKDGLLASTNDSTDSDAPDKDKNFPALNDVQLPFANPPPPRDHVLKPVKRFFSKFYSVYLHSMQNIYPMLRKAISYFALQFS